MDIHKQFKAGLWQSKIDVSDFVQANITPYYGDASFLAGPSERTLKVWNKCLEALEEERARGGVRSLDNKTVSTITSHKAGYIDQENELIVGLQTDELLKRAIKPFGGINVVSRACHEHGIEVDERVKEIFTNYRKTHNDGVFDAYTEEIRSFRSLGFLTGLPDNYARGRIIGDYRRVALYGVDRLIEDKEEQKRTTRSAMYSDVIRDREELSEQIRALHQLKQMAASYGFDISKPATNTKEAIQWLYFGYLGAVKEQNGAAMSLGRTSTFLDVYAQRDLKNGTFTEEQIQEKVKELAAELSREYAGKDPIFVGVLKGVVMFFADMVKRIDIPCQIDFMWISSYAGTESTGNMLVRQDLTTDVKGRHVVILEDIYDTGTSLNFVYNHILAKEPASLKICTLLDKPERRRSGITLKADYTGFEIPNAFVIGYGLDYNEKYRNLPYVGILKPEVYL